MTLDIHNSSSTAHQEINKIVKDEILPIVNQVDVRVQNFELHFLKETTKFVRDFKYLAKEADESLAKHKALEFEIERLLRAVVSQDIMSIVQSNFVVDTSNLQTELDRTKEQFENSYNNMQQKIERLQAQLGDLKGKSKDTQCVSDTLDSLSQKLDNKNVSEQKDITKGTSANTKFANQSTSGTKLYSVTLFLKSKIFPKVVEMNDLSKLVTSNLVPTPTESKVMTNDKVTAPGMFRINSFKTSREDKFVIINKVRASIRTNPITVSQPHFLGTVRFGNDHVAAIIGYADLQWGNILITRVYFVEGLGHNLFLVGQFCDSNLDVDFRRNTCFVRNLEGVDLLKGNCRTNLYTINLHEMAFASPICLMARTTSTKL
ncbi:hypothetical protein Tco_0822276 [Tanacetum coccineum]|uniref:Integrase, catalytic region, zinc finger, CCHC-type, peptidase aspartic, catalytic n=1 Tax=Tanacetum coccineum TaxID=301880 RepID=A0ABQ5AHQ5_9ASTR